MSEKKFFIYDRKEILILMLLAVMIALFAFTLGVHLGKKVGEPHRIQDHQTQLAETAADRVAGRVELTEHEKGTEAAVDELLNETLHDEVTRTGIKIDSPRQVQLPDQPRSKNAGATTLKNSAPKSSPQQQAEKIKSALQKVAVKTDLEQAHPKMSQLIEKTPPHGKYTLQVGSYPSLDEAGQHVGALESLGMDPFLRPALVKGGRWYRIYLGGFTSRQEAEEIAKNYVKRHIINSFVVAKMPSKSSSQ